MFEIFDSLGYLGFALIISKSDINRRIISNRNLVLFGIFSLLVNPEFIQLASLRTVSFAIFLLVSFAIIFMGRIGPGDLKLFLVMTIWAPVLLNWLEFFAWAWILGGIFSVVSSLISRRIGASIPFAPFIFLAFTASI